MKDSATESIHDTNISSSNHSPMSSSLTDMSERLGADRPAPETIAPKGYLPFIEARRFAKTLSLKTRKEWRSYVKGDLTNMPAKPVTIPAHPDGIYKVKGWQGWKYWLGTADVGLNR